MSAPSPLLPRRRASGARVRGRRRCDPERRQGAVGIVTPLEQVELGIEMLDSVTRQDPEYRGAGERAQIRLEAIRKRVSPES